MNVGSNVNFERDQLLHEPDGGVRLFKRKSEAVWYNRTTGEMVYFNEFMPDNAQERYKFWDEMKNLGFVNTRIWTLVPK